MKYIDIENEKIWREVILHGQRVADMCCRVAELLNLNTETYNNLLIAAAYHDIGKLGISERILFKADKLTEEEFETIKKHSHLGYYVMNKVECLNKYKRIVLLHHERYDGSGYPYGLAGDKIPLESKIIGICDVYDALINDRTYRKAYTEETALMIIKDEAYKYDSAILKAFIRNIESVQYKKAL